MRTLGIFLFNDVEVLDFAGPFEVFSLAEVENSNLFNVVTISETGNPITARNGLQVNPLYGFDNHPALDILIIPGGHGAEKIEIDQDVIQWIVDQFEKVEILASVCTGAFLLAKADLLNGREVTTHWKDIEKFQTKYPKLKVLKDVKFVDQGDLITSGGISAGINMSFYLLSKLHGKEVAAATAKRMEYDIELND